MSRHLTPTVEAEESRHRAECRDLNEAWRSDMAWEARCDPSLTDDPTAPADPRYGRIREALAAAADPRHPHHVAEVRNVAAMRAEVPLMVALEESIAAHRNPWAGWGWP